MGGLGDAGRAGIVTAGSGRSALRCTDLRALITHTAEVGKQTKGGKHKKMLILTHSDRERRALGG
jgi:hypothetical protein